MLRQDELETCWHMSDVLLASFRGVLQPASPKTLPECDCFRIPIYVLPLQRQQFAKTNGSQCDTPEQSLPARRHFLQNLLNVLSTPNRHLFVLVLWSMQLSPYGIAFDQIMFRSNFEHDV